MLFSFVNCYGCDCPTRILYLHPAMHLASAELPSRARTFWCLAGRLGTSAGDGAVQEIRRARLGLPPVHIAGGATSAPRRPSHPCRGRSAAPCRIFSTSNSNWTPRTSSEIGISGGGGGLLFVFSVRDWNNQRLWSVAAGPRAGRGGGG
jgi:hypothetical protein